MSSTDDNPDGEPKPQLRLALLVGGGIFIIWWLIVLASAKGAALFGPWDFLNTGQLGDSFGIVSALMASLAAVFTFTTMRLSQQEAAQLRTRERERGLIDLKRDRERVLFQLMEHRHKVMLELTVARTKEIYNGTQAADQMVVEMKDKKTRLPNRTYLQIYTNLYNAKSNELGHYFRFTYHIIKYAKENFEPDVAYQYVRLLRAQMSRAEQVLLAFNALSIHGRDRMKPLVEEFCLLHSLPPVDRMRFGLIEKFHSSAFERLSSDADT